MDIKREDNISWIINKHTSSFDLLLKYLKVLKENKKINDEVIEENLSLLNDSGVYNPRYGRNNKTTFKNKINELAFYMFGFKYQKKFIISPLGNLLLKHIENEENIKKIFLSMLWGFQFSHPENRTDEEFKIYPFRLFYKLLTENRLSNYLDTIEVIYFLYFIKTINQIQYEELIDEIIEFRKLKFNEKIQKLFEANVGRQDNINKTSNKIANEIWWANKVHEWDYYFTTFIKGANIIEITIGELNHKLRHFTNNDVVSKTYRTLSNTKYTIPNDLLNFVSNIEKEYPFYSTPISKEELSPIEFKTTIYNFMPNALLKDIDENGTEFKILNEILDKEKENYDTIDLDDLVDSSIRTERFNDFEFYIEKTFNIFSDIQANRISGAGNTDVECIYGNAIEKFNIDTKTRKNQLTEINTSRLKNHRVKNGAIYTIIITSKYSIGAKQDIKESQNTLLKSDVFANYMFNVINSENKSYGDLRKIITKNLGKSASKELADFNFEKYSFSIP